jgi:phosphoenolpyruvate carboxylase
MLRSVLTYSSRGRASTSSTTRRTLSSFSSFAEPNPTLFVAPKLKDDENAQLRADIKVMGSVLGTVLRETAAPAAAGVGGGDDDPHDSSIFDHVEALRAAAKKWRQGDGDLQVLADRVAKLTDSQLKDVSRAFTHFLALANAAEAHHRIRRLSKYVDTPLFPKDDSCGGVIPSLLENGTATADEIFDALTSQTTELVLTAHPTEVNRRTVLNKNHRIQQILTASDIEQNSYKRQLLDDALLQEIRSLWLTDEVSRTKPSPETEAAKGTLVVETVLWEAVPSFLRKLSATLQNAIGRSLPLTAAPVRFASWMGGDRDGNPNVKPSTTATVCMTNRRTAATLFCHDLEKLNGELSIAAATDDLLRYDSREPYRTHIGKMLQKMRRTKEWATACLEGRGNGGSSTTADSGGGGGGGFGAVHRDNLYLEKEDLWNDLMVMHRSLCATGNAVIADGRLTDILRNVSAFGLPLIPLDVRQESDRHMEALDAISKFLGLGSYTQWDEETKISWLTSQISNRRPLIRSGVWKDHPESFSDTVVDTLETFAMIAAQHEGSLGAYVISQATTASDVLAVLLLQLDAGVKKPLRVAPLFETLDDLNGAESTMRKLFSLPVYMGYIKGKQEVMIGYSDSAKDAGRLAASWAQYETQEILAATAKEFNVDLTFFHGTFFGWEKLKRCRSV